MSDKYLMFSLDDPRSLRVAEVLSNRTSKKILDFLADSKEASESDIAKGINAPLNTVGYNIKKLLEVGLVVKCEKFFWSVRGKKIPTYKISNKSIVISPSKGSRKFLTSLVTLGIIGIGSLFVKLFTGKRVVNQYFEYGVYDASFKTASDSAMLAVPDTARSVGEVAVNTFTVDNVLNGIPSWSWFLIGGITVLLVMLIINWRRL